MIEQKPKLQKPNRNIEIVTGKNLNRQVQKPIQIERKPHEKPIKLASDEWPDIYLNARVHKIFAQQNEYYSTPEMFFGGKAVTMSLSEIGNSIGRLDSWMVKHFNSRKTMEERDEDLLSEEDHKDVNILSKEKYKLGEDSEKRIGQLPLTVAHFHEFPEILASIQTPPYSNLDTKYKIDTIFVTCPSNTPVELKANLTYLLQSMMYKLVSTFEIDDYTPFSYVQTPGKIDNAILRTKEYQQIEAIEQTAQQLSEQFHEMLQLGEKDNAKMVLIQHDRCLKEMYKNYEILFARYGIELEFKGIQVKTSPVGKEKSLEQNPELGVLLPPTKAMVHYKNFYHNNTSAGNEVRQSWDMYLEAFQQVLGL
jgi:hypothetical protein